MFVFVKAAKLADRGADGLKMARRLTKGAIVGEGAVVAVRGYQTGSHLLNGDTGKAAGTAAETLLRLVGLRASASELKVLNEASSVLAKTSGTGLSEAVNQFGCFDAETECLITESATISSNKVSMSNLNVGDSATLTMQSETAVKIKDVSLGSRVRTKNPNRQETQHDLANEGFKNWKKVSLEVQHANGSTVDVEILRSPDWIEQNGLKAGNWFSFDITEIDIKGSGFVKIIEDAPDVDPGEGSVVIGRFVTREVGNRVEVTLENHSCIVGTANHPVWCVEAEDWIGLGEFELGQHMRSRNGTVKVVGIKNLKKLAPVYNLEVAGEHVYEITGIGVLVHNANWDCGEWLKFRGQHLNGTLKGKDIARYEELLDNVENKFRQFLTKAEIDKLLAAAPENIVRGHLHHILVKLGTEKHTDRVLAIQKKLWKDYGIDPVMSADIYTWAPMAGVHGDLPVVYVIESLEGFLSQARTQRGVLSKLKTLGNEAQEGFPGVVWR